MKKSEEIRDHLNQLRKEMEKEGVDTLMIPTADYHNSEYAAEYFAARKYYSGSSRRTGPASGPTAATGFRQSGR